MITMHTFFSDDPSLNPAEAIFFCKIAQSENIYSFPY